MAVFAHANFEPIGCNHCVIRNTSLCAALDDNEIKALNNIAVKRTLQDGECFVFEGDTMHSFANVISGVAKLTQSFDDGREQIVGVLFPTDFIGGAFTGTKTFYSCTVQAAGGLELCVYPASRFDQLLKRYPNLEHKVLEKTQRELDTARDWMTMLGRKTASERVATFLYYFAVRSTESMCKPGVAFDMPFTRADIADFTGLTYETVSRQISRLRKDGVIEMSSPRHITSVNMEELAQRSGRTTLTQ